VDIISTNINLARRGSSLSVGALAVPGRDSKLRSSGHRGTLVFREAEVRFHPHVRDEFLRHVILNRLAVTESRLRIDGMAGAQQK